MRFFPLSDPQIGLEMSELANYFFGFINNTYFLKSPFFTILNAATLTAAIANTAKA
jgi:hypothetical protein